MKRIEKLSNVEIVDLCLKVGNCRFNDDCGDCPIREYCHKCYDSDCDCEARLKGYFNEEIQKKIISRWELIESDDDLIFLEKIYCCHRCDECPYHSGEGSCFKNFLIEKIEVEAE